MAPGEGQADSMVGSVGTPAPRHAHQPAAWTAEAVASGRKLGGMGWMRNSVADVRGRPDVVRFWPGAQRGAFL